jgi:uncharacterized repeat protein (TIGR01451 family)
VKRYRLLAAFLVTLLVMSTGGSAFAAHQNVTATQSISLQKPNGQASTLTFADAGAGAQQFLPSTAVFTMNNGTLQPGGSFSIPQGNISISGVPQININGNKNHTMNIVGAATGTLNPRTGAMTLTMQVRHNFTMQAQSFLTGARNCELVYPVTMTSGTSGSLTGSPYDPTTGQVSLVANEFAIPAATSTAGSCNATDRTNINNQLGLPKAAGTPKMAATFTVPINQRPNGDLTVSQSTTTLVDNRPATITVTVGNVGLQESTGPFVVVDTLPEGLTYTGFAGVGWDCTADEQDVTCTYGDELDPPHLAPASQLPVLTIDVDAGEVYPSVVNTVTVSSVLGSDEDWNATNNTSQVTINVQPPNVRVVKTHSGNFTIGDTEAYTIAVDNVGAAPTVGATTVVDTVPGAFDVVGATGDGWDCDTAGQIVTCVNDDLLDDGAAFPPITLEVIPTGDSDYSVTNTAVVSTPRDDAATGNNVSNDLTHVRFVDLGITKVTDPALFTVGQDASYTVSVTNAGSAGTFGPVTVVDVLPEDTRFIDVDAPGWDCAMTPAGNAEIVTCTIASLASNETAGPIVISVDVLQSAVPGVTNITTVSTPGDVDLSDNEVVLDTEVRVPLPDLAIVQATDGPIVVGQTVDRRFSVDNHGTGPTLGPITVQHTLPTGFTFDSVSGDGWACSTFAAGGSTVLRCVRNATLAAGDAADDIVLTLNVTPAAFPSKSSTATVSTRDEHPTLLGDNQTTTTLTVTANDLAITKTASDMRLGEDGEYTIAVTNVGTATTSHPAIVTDQLPEGMSYDGFASAGGDWDCDSVNEDGRDTVTCEYPAGVEAGDPYDALTIFVEIGDAAWPAVDNTASVATQHELNLANNSSTASSVVRAPDLSIEKSSSDLLVGTTGTFTIDVTNEGDDVTAGDTVVTDLLPTGLDYDGFSGAGWDCTVADVDGRDEVTCTNAGVLDPDQAYAPLLITVDVTTAASPEATNTALVEGARDLNDENDSGSVTQTVRAPDLEITKTANGVFTTGFDATFTIQVTNIGNASSVGTTTVVDELPFGFAYQGASGDGWTCGAVTNGDGSQTVTCTNDTVMTPGAALAPLVLDVDVVAVPGDYENTATVSDQDDPVLDNNSTTIDVTVYEPLVDLAVDKSSADDFVYGGSGTYTIQVTNVGRAPNTQGITLTDTLPAGLDPTSASGTGWNCSIDGQVVTCTTNALLAPGGGAANPVSVVVDIGEDAFPEVSNTATASTFRDPNPANNSGTDTRPVTAADYTITKDASAFNLGENGTFTIVVTNDGDAASTGGVTVTDTLPAGLTYVSGTGTDWSCNAAGQVVTCTNGETIAAGDSYAPITITVGTGEAAHPGFTNTAAVTGPFDIDPSNNSDDAEVAVTRPDLEITKSGNGALNVGDEGVYTIAVDNVGDGATTGTATVTDVLPTGLTYVSGAGSGWTCGAAGQTVTCTSSDVIAGGGSYPDIALTVDVDTDAWDEVTNEASVDAPFDANASNDSSSSTREVTAPDMSIEKSHLGYFTIGAPASYRISITNEGTAPTVGTVLVNDLLPEGLRYDGNDGPFACLPMEVGNQDLVVCATSSPVAPGETRVMNLAVTVDVPALPGVTNVATVIAERDPNPANDESSDETFVALPSGDLTLSKSHTGDFVVGPDNQYRYTVGNVGAYPTLGSITVFDTLPTGLVPQSASGDGWGCMIVSQSFGCTHPGPLQPGDELPVVTLTVTATMAATPSANSTANVATVGDPVMANNTDDDPTTVRHVDLALEKTLVGTPTPGAPVTYQLTATNIGTSPTLGQLMVVDVLPPSLTGATATGAGWSCGTTVLGGATSVLCSRASALAAGASSTITLVANLASGATGTLLNAASITTQHDVDGANNTGTSSHDLGGPVGPPPTVPGAPTVTGVTAGDQTLTVAFTAPASNGGATITNYEYSLNGGSTWTPRDPASTSSPLELTGLTNGVTRQVALRAVNSVGAGPQSNAMIGRPQAPASEVNDLTAVAQDTAVRIRWTPPTSDGGLAITRYQVVSSPDGRRCSTDADGRTCVVRNLRNGVAYTFSVVAITEAGQGDEATIEATPRTKPSAPRQLGATAGNRSAALRWAAPLSNGGAAITKYVARCVPRDSSLANRRATTNGARNVTVGNMRNGKTYDCQVRAVNAAGPGPWSSKVAVRPRA